MYLRCVISKLLSLGEFQNGKAQVNHLVTSSSISENILDGILADISSEILGGCDTVIDGMVASELKE